MLKRMRLVKSDEMNVDGTDMCATHPRPHGLLDCLVKAFCKGMTAVEAWLASLTILCAILNDATGTGMQCH